MLLDCLGDEEDEKAGLNLMQQLLSKTAAGADQAKVGLCTFLVLHLLHVWLLCNTQARCVHLSGSTPPACYAPV